MLHTIETGLRTVRRAIRLRKEASCYTLLSKEFSDVNPRGINQTLVIDKYRVAYNMIRKNGSSSMMVLWNTILSGKIEPPEVCLQKLRHIWKLKESEISGLKDYRWLVIVRNPYVRVLSAFMDKFRREKIIARHGKFDLSPSGFRDFLRWLEDGNLGKNGHWDLQMHEVLLPISAYTDVIRLENLHEDAPGFFAKANVPLDKIDLDAVYRRGSNHKTESNSKIEAFYDDRTQERVYKLYETDFTNFGYGPNLDGTFSDKPVVSAMTGRQ